MKLSFYQSLYQRAALILFSLFLLVSCASLPPEDSTNLCKVFEEERSWYLSAKNSEAKWGVPISVSMAIIYQESGFRSRAKPARGKFLWFFPGARPSSAYGFAQALDSTWADYENQTGNRRSSRSNFGDAVDFVGWYNAGSNRQSGISRNDAYSLYLAYHEGNGGYQRGTFRDKQWLMTAASAVQANAIKFDGQLKSCSKELNKNWFQRLLF